MFVEEYLVDLRRQRYRPRAWTEYVRRCLRLARETAFHRPEVLRSIGLIGVGGFLVLLAVTIPVALLLDRGLGFEIFVKSGLTLLLGLVVMAAHVRLLVDVAGRPLRRMNAANVLTLSRLVVIPGILALVEDGRMRLAVIAFGLGALTDVLDGWLARHRGEATPFGRMFDPVVDILFNAAVFVGLHAAGLVPTWVLALVLTRYGLLLGGGVYLYIFRGPVEIKPTVLGKSTGVVMTLLVLALVGGRILLPPGVDNRIEPILVAAIGFVEAITLPQVILIGWYNFKKAGGRHGGFVDTPPGP